MKTIRQVAKLTGISVRTLQYYDEIQLLAPSAVTKAGYRLYDENALEKIQQILFFKELGFQLKEIREILGKPDFNKLEAYKKQKKLLCLKRNRLNRLIALLERLEKGEACMDFKKFDLTDYIRSLEEFKNRNHDEVVKYWGSLEQFEEMVERIKTSEPEVAEMAVKQFGSIEKYTEAMKNNLEHFSELMERADSMKENAEEILQKSNTLMQKLTSDKTKDIASDEIQNIVDQIVNYTKETSWVDMGEGYWDIVIEGYESDLVKTVTDQKYGEGASDYIIKAIKYYFQSQKHC